MADPRLEELRELQQRALGGGGKRRVYRQHAKGKLTARERLALLLDERTFNELNPFVTLRDDSLGSSPERYPGGWVPLLLAVYYWRCSELAS